MKEEQLTYEQKADEIDDILALHQRLISEFGIYVLPQPSQFYRDGKSKMSFDFIICHPTDKGYSTIGIVPLCGYDDYYMALKQGLEEAIKLVPELREFNFVYITERGFDSVDIKAKSLRGAFVEFCKKYGVRNDIISVCESSYKQKPVGINDDNGIGICEGDIIMNISGDFFIIKRSKLNDKWILSSGEELNDSDYKVVVGSIYKNKDLIKLVKN